jgi:SAM-dependent methyltransferase
MRRLNDPALVREQYADEKNLGARKAIYAGAEGPDPRELAFQAIAEVVPATVLEVGGGEGELAERVVRELGAELVLVDQSERMVEISRGRGLDARVGDVQSLPFADESFDCTVAAWMLYHADDVGVAISELARVTRPGGRLVAVTNGAGHLAQLRELAGESGWWTGLPFSRENGAELLRRSFSKVEAHRADGWVSIPDDETIRAYLRSMSGISPPSELRPHELPLRVQRKPTIFVATK